MQRPKLNTGSPHYMRSFYLRFCIYAIQKWPFSGTYPLIYSHPRSFYKQIPCMRAHFCSPYLSHITRSTCMFNFARMDWESQDGKTCWKDWQIQICWRNIYQLHSRLDNTGTNLHFLSLPGNIKQGFKILSKCRLKHFT